jgi:POT family proton-dependent oligopeptide transporter
MQATNSILVLLLIPIFNYILYPLLSKAFELTPLRKIGLGLFVTVPSFAVPAWIQMQIDAGQTPHISWQLLAYVIITMAEVMVSITTLEFSYTQAPKEMKSFIMGLFLLSVTLGNIATERVNHAIQVQQEQGATLLAGARYYWFFTIAMLVTACLFVLWSRFYRGQTYIQGDKES